MLLFRAVVLSKIMYGAEVAAFTKDQIEKVQIRTLDTLRPFLRGKRRNRTLAFNLLYYDTPVDIRLAWFLHCVRSLRAHLLDHYPDECSNIIKIWDRYVGRSPKGFGPIRILFQAAQGIKLTPCLGGRLLITTVLCYVFLPTTFIASLYSRNDKLCGPPANIVALTCPNCRNIQSTRGWGLL